MRTLFPVLLTVLLLGSAGIYAQENKPARRRLRIPCRVRQTKSGTRSHEARTGRAENNSAANSEWHRARSRRRAFDDNESAGRKQVVTQATSQSDLDALHEEVDTLKSEIKGVVPGTTKFLLAGYGTAGFTARSGEDPFFDASFNAIFLWKLTDRLLFEGELEFRIRGRKYHD